MRLNDDALVLRRTPFRETSLLVHFFTRHHGLLTAMARGVRSARRSATVLDRAALAGFHTMAMGRHARTQHAVGTLTFVEIKRPRHRLLHAGTALLAAQVAQETLYRFMSPWEARPEVFELVEWAWNMLDAGEDPLAVAGICQGRLVRALGYGWRTDCCAGCGGKGRLTYFSAKRGQVVCAVCAAPYVHRLFLLGEPLYDAVRHLEWTTDFGALPKDEKATLYRMGMASLTRLGGRAAPLNIVSDQPFRTMSGIDVHPPGDGACLSGGADASCTP